MNNHNMNSSEDYKNSNSGNNNNNSNNNNNRSNKNFGSHELPKQRSRSKSGTRTNRNKKKLVENPKATNSSNSIIARNQHNSGNNWISDSSRSRDYIANRQNQSYESFFPNRHDQGDSRNSYKLSQQDYRINNRPDQENNRHSYKLSQQDCRINNRPDQENNRNSYKLSQQDYRTNNRPDQEDNRNSDTFDQNNTIKTYNALHRCGNDSNDYNIHSWVELDMKTKWEDLIMPPEDRCTTDKLKTTNIELDMKARSEDILEPNYRKDSIKQNTSAKSRSSSNSCSNRCDSKTLADEGKNKNHASKLIMEATVPDATVNNEIPIIIPSYHYYYRKKPAENNEIIKNRVNSSIVKDVMLLDILKILSRKPFLSTQLDNLEQEYNIPPSEVTEIAQSYYSIFSLAEDTIKLSLSLKICLQHNTDHGCRIPECPELHICQQYINNACGSTESECLSGHSWTTNHNMELLVRYCMDKFSHFTLKTIYRERK